ncbi:unnamed protein product, partial [Nesidiocoris tenuis]
MLNIVPILGIGGRYLLLQLCSHGAEKHSLWFLIICNHFYGIRLKGLGLKS